jgi:hypothetical protein
MGLSELLASVRYSLGYRHLYRMDEIKLVLLMIIEMIKLLNQRNRLNENKETLVDMLLVCLQRYSNINDANYLVLSLIQSGQN